MPARDISAIAEDMIDTLLEENFDLDEAYGITESSLTVYLTLMQERVLGQTTVGAIEAAANEAAHLIVDRVRIQKERGSRPYMTASEVIVEEPTVPAPTRFERDPVI